MMGDDAQPCGVAVWDGDSGGSITSKLQVFLFEAGIMSRDRDELLAERKRLKAEYRRFFDEVQALLFRHDPIGINFEDNVDEYAPEVGTILPRLKSCQSEEETRRIVHEEFNRWFDGDAGTEDQYAKIARDIWRAWRQFSKNG